MEKTKERRIKKLKKRRIWPSVIGLFFVVGLLVVAVAREMKLH